MLYSNNCKLVDSLLSGSKVDYPSDSLASCSTIFYFLYIFLNCRHDTSKLDFYA